MKLIYVASPYAGDVKKNIAFAKRACRFVMEQGHAFFAPHLLYPQILDDTDPEERKTGLKLGLHVLEKCDELWVYGNRISAGMEAEIELAKQLEIPIHYVSEEQILGNQAQDYAIWAKRDPTVPLRVRPAFYVKKCRRNDQCISTQTTLRQRPPCGCGSCGISA